MGASYAVMDYMGLFLAVTVGAVVVILALTILLGVYLAKKFRKALLAYLPLFGMAAALFLLGQYILPILDGRIWEHGVRFMAIYSMMIMLMLL